MSAPAVSTLAGTVQSRPQSLLTRAPLIAALVACWLYLPSLTGGFLYDDLVVVVGNRAIRDLSAWRTVLLFEPSRPLLNLSWALNYAAGGLDPFGYHLVNVLIHAANAALVASLVAWIARRPGAGRTFLGEAPDPRGAALFAGCLFAVNPMAVETVTYIASRSSGLATLFALVCLRVAVSDFDRPAVWRKLTAVSFFLLALATKEEAAAIPLLLLLLDYFFVAQRTLRSLWPRWRMHCIFLLLPLIGLCARRWVTGAWLPAPAVPHGIYALTQLAAFPLYLLRCLVPVDPAFYRHHPVATWPPGPETLAWCAAAIIILFGALRLRHRFWLASFAVGWLLAGLLPSSSIVPLREMVVDHRAYLGGIGVVCAAGVLASAREFWLFRSLLLAMLLVRCLFYQVVLIDNVAAWMDAIERAPRSAEAWRTLADSFAAREDPRALEAFKRAVTLDQSDARNWSALGTYCLSIGQDQEALQAMLKAVSLAPKDARMRDNLGLVLAQQGRLAEASIQFREAIHAAPRLARPRVNLAAALLRMGDLASASGLLDEAAVLEMDEEDARGIEDLRARVRERAGR